MKITIPKPIEIEITHIRVRLPLNYGEEDIPCNSDLPLRNGDWWEAIIDIDTGKIVGWPEGRTESLYLKVCDGGTYVVLDDQGEVVASINEDYVPNGVIPGRYGDYVELEIDATGRITNWGTKALDVARAFFPEVK